MGIAKKYQHTLVWFRRDLRTKDHVAFSQAIQQSENVSCVFVFDTTILDKLKDKNDRRVVFIHRSLQEIDHFLSRLNAALIVKVGDPSVLIPELAKKLQVDAVFTNEDFEPYAKERDQRVSLALTSQNQELIHFKDQVIFAKDEILNQEGKPYRVFTSYKNKWLSEFSTTMVRDVSFQNYNFTPYETLKPFLSPWRLKDIGFENQELLIDAGEEAAQLRLATFAKKVSAYDKTRDYPAIDLGTSGLSVCLRFGTISIRACVRMALSSDTQGARVWLSELIWRDFYHMILDQFPHVVTKPFLSQYTDLAWPGSKAHFEAWSNGQTGYPIVDAAMRCLNETGLMHNRLRMIVAMFLTKDLLCDYRWGEAYFARHLLDFDLAANNGGWQWSASTGCDAQPYFRVFNPWTQSEKFDADGAFIRRFCPELMDFKSKHIHHPHLATLAEQKNANCIIGKDYPAPIVDHNIQRKLAIELFKK